MLDTKKKDREQAMHAALTKIFLFLKGDGTVSSLQKKIGVHRNMLTAIFEMYDAQMRGDEVRTTSVRRPRITKLYWGINSLITAANTLGIPLSELIRAAEDVENGLPPWFRRRISYNADPQSIEELGNIFLEALGCFTYADPFPEAAKKERRYHRRDEIPELSSTRMVESYTEEECCAMTRIAIQTIEASKLKEFKDKYMSKAITSEEAYRIIEKAVNYVRKHDRIEGKFDTDQLFGNREALSCTIQYYWENKESEFDTNRSE